MAEDCVYQETVPAARSDKILRVFIVVAVMCLGGELFWLLGITPFRPFSRIAISGYDEISKAEILATAGITASSSYFSTNAAAVEKALMEFKVLESVKVFKHFPDRLQIVLEGREAVASVLASFGGKTVPVLFDSQGVIFQIGGSEKDEFLSRRLPVISGLVIEDPVPGMKLPALFVPLFRELEKIQVSSPELLEAVSELRISRKAFDTFDIILYPVHKKIKVSLSELNEDLLRYSLLMVDVLASREGEIETLDFRSGVASYIPREASFE